MIYVDSCEYDKDIFKFTTISHIRTKFLKKKNTMNKETVNIFPLRFHIALIIERQRFCDGQT